LRLIERFIITLVFELGDMKIKTMGSTTMNFVEKKRGAEPDCAYYIQNQSTVAGRTVDFAVDPPPDLVMEVDITHTDIDKNRLYAAMGIAEFWRYNGEILRIYHLENGEYQESEQSRTFPIIEKADLYDFLAQAQQDEMEAERTFRKYVQSKIQNFS
jgi:Uma2 family endonuclease